MLKTKLLKSESSTHWHYFLTFSEILELYDFTKNLPIVPLAVRKYCYLNNIKEYPNNITSGSVSYFF